MSRLVLLTVAALLSAAALGAAVPDRAAAGPKQISIFQDDANFVVGSTHDADAAVAEAKALGADAIRVFVVWSAVSPDARERTRPAGFDVADPDSEGYDWSRYDTVIERAKRNGLRVFLAFTPEIPYWASEQPRRCPHRIGGYDHLADSCMWNPSPRLFGQFVAAVAKRYGRGAPAPYGGQVDYWSPWNEPNLEHYLMPQTKRTRWGMVDLAGKRYRALWQAAYRSIARYDRRNRGRVLFGETAAISSPLDTLHAALCLDQRGMPFKGRMRRLQGCGGRVRRLPIGGLALHPYNNYAIGSVFTRAATKDSLPMAHLHRAHTFLRAAQRHKRIPPRRGIYVTEFGFQSSPPNPFGDGLPLVRQAAALNEADRLFWGDRRIRSVAQYELFDVGNPDEFNTGLRFADGEAKPSLAAYRLPLVVSRLAANRVEVWGQVRPAERPVRVRVEIAGGGVVRRPRTNARGFYRFVLRRPGAARLRLRAAWTDGGGELHRSRVARAGKPIAYRRD
ncbi:MAG: hypothetical protein GXY03_08325 [Solirubrobacterales bacterium]|nr:hypothetical protein [Solirubrobacterales bacterium]